MKEGSRIAFEMWDCVSPRFESPSAMMKGDTEHPSHCMSELRYGLFKLTIFHRAATRPIAIFRSLTPEFGILTLAIQSEKPLTYKDSVPNPRGL